MILTIVALIIRIFSNSFLNVFQKRLTLLGQKSSIVNFYTYAGLSLLCLPMLIEKNITFSIPLLSNVLIMGLLGALGNYYIIKALSLGELSTLAPINSYKPVIATIIGIFYLKEIPSNTSIYAILIIILSSFLLFDVNYKSIEKKAVLYRFLALIFSATEAIFIKKIIILTDISYAFYLWCFAGFLGSTIFLAGKNSADFKIKSFKLQILLILAVALMQFSTNLVFDRMNVAYALAIFQASTIVSVIFGANFFKETNLPRKITATIFMIIGAVILILN